LLQSSKKGCERQDGEATTERLGKLSARLLKFSVSLEQTKSISTSQIRGVYTH